MRIEHIGLNVEAPKAMANWYCEHLGTSIVRQVGETCFFLADDEASTVLEIYHNPAAPVPDYRNTDPLVLHVAYASTQVQADYDRLIAAGATGVSEAGKTPAGDTLAMLRDPWGVAVQLVCRAEPL